jgi:hypothetical protein
MVCRSIGGCLWSSGFFFLTPPPQSTLEMVGSRLHRLFKQHGVDAANTFAPSFAQYASAYPSVAANQLARQRATQMYALLHQLLTVPHGVPAMVGILMDAHAPLATSTCVKVFMAYRLSLSPELVTTAGTMLSASTTVRKMSMSGADGNGLKRLIAKGGPFPRSVRYVQAQLYRACGRPETAIVMKELLYRSLVGAYAHCKIIATPTDRFYMQAKPALELLAHFTSGRTVASHEYYYLVAEFVYACSVASPLEWWWVRGDSKYEQYAEDVIAAGDAFRSGLASDRMTLCDPRSIADPPASVHGLALATGNRKKLPWNVVSTVPAAKIASTFKGIVCGPTLGIAVTLLSHIDSSVSFLAAAASVPEQRRLYLMLPPAIQAMVQVVSHALLARVAIALVPLTQSIAAAQKATAQRHTGSSTHYATVCIACSTWRPKTPLLQMSRGSVGVQFTFPFRSSVTCNACGQDWGIRLVDLVGVAIRVKTRIDADLTWVVLCTRCGRPTNTALHRGVMPECVECRATPNPDQSCYKCHTSNGILTEHQATHNSRRIAFWSCARHVPRIIGPESVDVGALIAMRDPAAGYIKSRF